jgi:hypothetical protein
LGKLERSTGRQHWVMSKAAQGGEDPGRGEDPYLIAVEHAHGIRMSVMHKHPDRIQDSAV